jgi:tetratricopeptide (TPR) repeat protein
MPDTREWFSTATELAEEGRYDEALALLDQGIRIDANNANAWYNKGVILFKMGRYQDALLAFAQATDIDPDFDQA